MLNAAQIEIALGRHFNWRQNLIVPKRPSGYAIEIEIKVSASDIKADTKKRRRHDSNLFRELWFAVPKKLADHTAIPERAGVLSVATTKWGHLRVEAVRRGKINPYALLWSPQQRQKLAHLGCMRIWSLKEARWNERNRKPRMFICAQSISVSPCPPANNTIGL